MQGAALLPHLPGYSGAHVDAAPGSWWEQLLDLDGAGIRQKAVLDLDGAGKEILDLDGARGEMPAVRGEYQDEYMSASKYMGHTRGHARGLSVHAEL